MRKPYRLSSVCMIATVLRLDRGTIRFVFRFSVFQGHDYGRDLGLGRTAHLPCEPRPLCPEN